MLQEINLSKIPPYMLSLPVCISEIVTSFLVRKRLMLIDCLELNFLFNSLLPSLRYMLLCFVDNSMVDKHQEDIELPIAIYSKS